MVANMRRVHVGEQPSAPLHFSSSFTSFFGDGRAASPLVWLDTKHVPNLLFALLLLLQLLFRGRTNNKETLSSPPTGAPPPQACQGISFSGSIMGRPRRLYLRWARRLGGASLRGGGFPLMGRTLFWNFLIKFREKRLQFNNRLKRLRVIERNINDDEG